MKETFVCDECDAEQEINGSKTILLGREGAGVTVVCDTCGHYQNLK